MDNQRFAVLWSKIHITVFTVHVFRLSVFSFCQTGSEPWFQVAARVLWAKKFVLAEFLVTAVERPYCISPQEGSGDTCFHFLGNNRLFPVSILSDRHCKISVDVYGQYGRESGRG